MSTTDNYDDNYDDEPEDQGDDVPRALRAVRKELKDAKEQLRQAREQAEKGIAAEREVALFRADLGVLNDDQKEVLLPLATQLTPEELRAKAQRLGVPVNIPEPAVPTEELDAQARIAGAHAGGAPTPDADYAAELDAAQTPEQIEAVMIKHTGRGFYDGVNVNT